ncbi:DUF1917-domain-containing protein [Trichodelitschia bisporula]|uniref:DUF1917-domain-containing protein n=1 Tax=Trichodelitschia bisporula TaxID=703511 RepID=A0A6G1I1S6_9PEZI|nr:DUF1917-domain-containing protein [Trichodelitschia bisporula]
MSSSVEEVDFSDDSSFYGNEDTKRELERQVESYDVNSYWELHPRMINTIAQKGIEQEKIEALKKKHIEKEALEMKSEERHEIKKEHPDVKTEEYPEVKIEKPHKRFKIDPAAAQDDLFDPLAGQFCARQLSETVAEFIKRVQPGESANVGPWLWVHNPHCPKEYRRSPGTAAFIQKGTRMLRDYLEVRSLLMSEQGAQIEAQVMSQLRPLQNTLRQDIYNLAKQERVTHGKWMLFPSARDVLSTWTRVAEATVAGKLGTGSKVAASTTSSDGSYLICIYTGDFSDEDDVRRVLKELVDMSLVPPGGRGIYYKADALTHLNIQSKNEYGLKASMYSSNELLPSHPKPKQSGKEPTTPKRQRQLTGYFGKSPGKSPGKPGA